MEAYKSMLREILELGEMSENRTGVDTKKLTGTMFKHNMNNGFPALTSKKIPMRIVATEMEFFLKGLSSKAWLQERNVHIWDEWCNPQIIKHSTDKDVQAIMKEQDDLGRIYGVQWRNWTHGRGSVDQVENVINKLMTNPLDRRMIVTAWNPGELDHMALPPCPVLWQVLSNGTDLDLIWYQRSCDMFLGVPFNIAGYGLLLSLIAKQVGMKPRRLIGFLADSHIYENHFDQVDELLSRGARPLPTLELPDKVNIFEWTADQFTLKDYDPHPTIKAPIAV